MTVDGRYKKSIQKLILSVCLVKSTLVPKSDMLSFVRS